MSVPERPSTRLTGSRSRSGARRRALHVLIGLASWIALGALWAWQVVVHVPSRWLEGIALIAALAVVWACFAIGWVTWCQSIYRRRHRRTKALLRHVDFERDTLGRDVLAPPGLSELAGQVLISVPGPGMKLYQLGERTALRDTQPLGELSTSREVQPFDEDVDFQRATADERREREDERREVA